MNESLLRLFKGYLGRKSSEINKEALRYGLLITGNADYTVVYEAIRQYGKDGEKLNQTFHKSFSKVKNTFLEDLFIEQLVHYFTTYDFEELGIYSKDKVFVPGEKLDIPELDTDTIELIVITPMTAKEISKRVMDIATSGIALSKETLEDIVHLSEFIDRSGIEEINNRELKIRLYEKLEIVPKNPEEYLRYLIYELTGETLKIKNSDLYSKIKIANISKKYKLLKKYLKSKEAYNRLASIFYRNKLLFLALKVSRDKVDNRHYNQSIEVNKYINKIRKLADANNRPMKKDVLDMLTQDVDIENEKEEILKGLEKVTVYREIRVLNGIIYRMLGSNGIVYKVRNGKSYATELKDKTPEYLKKLQNRYEIVKEHLVNRVSRNVKGKKIYIPANVSYTVPTSEKQFNGNYPDGSYIEVPRESDIVYGIHWTNLLVEDTSDNELLEDEDLLSFDEICDDDFNDDDKSEIIDEQIESGIGEGIYVESEEKKVEKRVDIDLKQMNENEVFGWDSSYRTEKGTILFSGDMTDAPLPNGATETFYVSKNYGNNAFLITVNDYTHYNLDVPYEFIIAKAEPNTAVDDTKNFTINPNNVIEKINLKVPAESRQMVVGLITIGDSIRLYLSDLGLGNGITSKRDENTMITLDYLRSYNKIQLRLKDLLKDAGAILTEKVEDAEIDLSINTITKDSIISLLSENKVE